MPGIRKNKLNLLNQPKASWIFPLVVALYITVFFNAHIYGLVKLHHKNQNITDMLFFLSIYCGVFFMVHFTTALLSLGKGMKLWLILLLLLSGVISYPRDHYTVVFDEIMLQNVIETDRNEAGELFSLAWVFYILVSAGLPAILVAIIPVKAQSLSKDLRHRFIAITSIAIFSLLMMMPFYKSYEQLLGSKLSVDEHIAPTAFLYAILKYANNNYVNINPEIMPLGTDAVLPETLENGKKIVMVIVVGESARTANFSLAGYPRKTNPLLENRLTQGKELVFYPNFSACGTSTLVSIPCMFSSHTQDQLNLAEEKYRENLLDVLAHAGMDVLWINNNLGCKNVCNRIRYIDMRGRTDNASCNKYGCSDMTMIKVLEDEIMASKDHLVVILHQKGSHGPAYSKRAPGMEIFTPACHASQLQKCSREEIINSYDNTILYTDTVLDTLIKSLEKYSDSRDTAMFYVSDHGESLGENNLYLHGMPMDIAPDEQTHIPAIMWLSQGFQQHKDIDYECLRNHSNEKYSHDNVFHTILGLLEIKTGVYRNKYDITRNCRKTH